MNEKVALLCECGHFEADHYAGECRHFLNAASVVCACRGFITPAERAETAPNRQVANGRERLVIWHQPWRFVLPRWFKCWRTTRHHERTFVGGGRQWTECYCGLRCFEIKGGPGA